MNRLTNQAIAGDEIDALVAEVCPPALVVSDTAVRQLRPLLEELLRLRKQETPQEAWKRGYVLGCDAAYNFDATEHPMPYLTPQQVYELDWQTPSLKEAHRPVPPLPYQEEKETGR